ncbi:MAG: hypothetical protein PHW69_07010 [Elusimicrobiaceae bacterium]|nr:hypothetical protein [Elusimicrobiaceae bacterium]
MSFSSIIGHARVISQLKKQLRANRIPPAFLFHGPKGVGKLDVAVILAMAANCLDETARSKGDACGVCRMCANIARGIHPDVAVIDLAYQAALRGEPVEKQQRIRIDTIREAIDRAQQKAVEARHKVFILDDAETMQPEAANSLLKMLEEPPAGTFWVLVSARRSSMLGTIISRAQDMTFSALTDSETAAVLAEQGFSAKEADFFAPLSQGSADRALKVRELMQNMADLDDMDPLYPFNVSARLPSELAAARRDAGLLVELLIEDAHRKMTAAGEPARADSYKTLLDTLFRRREAINRNVSPHRVLETAVLECEKLKIRFFPAQN